jgi:hypothetical protein
MGAPSSAVIVAQAHALLALGIPNAVPLIEARAANSADEARSALLSLVRRAP